MNLSEGQIQPSLDALADATDSEPIVAIKPDHDFVRGSDVELGHALAAELGAKGDVVAVENRVWRYNGATWDCNEDERLSQRAQKYDGKFVLVVRKDKPATVRPIVLSNNAVNGIVKQCKVSLFEPQFFATAPFGAPFATTFARIDGKRVYLERLTRRHRVKSEHACAFDPPRDGPRPAAVDWLLASTWDGCHDIDQRVQYFWEWLGAAICGIATRYKDTPLLVGPQDAGKSQVLQVIFNCFPVATRRSVTLHAMASDYHRAHLSGGRINFVNELPARDLLDGEAAKAILSGDTVSCRRPMENVFDWVNPRCAHVFACNSLPPSQDPALMGRFVVLDCPNVVARDKQDRTIGERILAEAHLVSATALRALPALLERGHLIRPAGSVQASEEWRMQSDPVMAWARECLSQNDVDGDSTKASDLFADFCAYAKENNHHALSIVKFGMRMKAMGFTSFRSDGIRWRASLIGPARAEAQARWTGNNRNWHGAD